MPSPVQLNRAATKSPRRNIVLTNWPDYDAALVRRGALTAWFTDEAIAELACTCHRKARRGQPIYSALAIRDCPDNAFEVFHQPLRQTEGLLRSIADVLDIDIAIPDHTTLSRRGVRPDSPAKRHPSDRAAAPPGRG